MFLPFLVYNSLRKSPTLTSYVRYGIRYMLTLMYVLYTLPERSWMFFSRIALLQKVGKWRVIYTSSVGEGNVKRRVRVAVTNSAVARTTDYRVYRLGGHFLAYIQLWWYFRSNLLRVGVHAHPISLHLPPPLELLCPLNPLPCRTKVNRCSLPPPSGQGYRRGGGGGGVDTNFGARHKGV
jgi:hypothetical protein